MDKMGYEPGLVRYTTEHALEGGTTHFMRPRLIGYALVLLLMIAGLGYAMMSRTAFELDIIRDRGSLYQLTPNDTVANSYTLEMMNMSQHELEYRIKIEGLNIFTSDVPETVTLHSNELRAYPFTIEADPADLETSKTNIEIIVYEEATQAEVAREESRFIAPLN
jgi:polyferredoxin